MDDKRICFITCVSDDTVYNEALYYMHGLTVPDGYAVDYVSVRKTCSVADGYNRAMGISHAKYKIYLRQNICLLNHDFLPHLIELFENNPEVGMVAAAGGRRLLPDGLWENACEKYGVVGKNANGGTPCSGVENQTGEMEEIEAAAAYWIATQCDLPFRVDGSAGDAFCEASQSLEFRRKSMKVVVPLWGSPSCLCLEDSLHRDGAFSKEREAFLDEYSKDLFPPVSLLIPAYNQTRFLKPALESALCQTYRNTEVIVSDDSTSEIVRDFIQPYLRVCPNLRYVKNGPHGNDHGMSNSQNCLEESRNDYVSFIFHDDIAEPEKIEEMMACCIQNPNIALVVSSFYYIDENGRQLSLTRYFDENTVLDGRAFIRHMLDKRISMVGAPSFPVFKKQFLNERGIAYWHGESFLTCADVAMWFSVLEHGESVYIAKPLSRFRINSGQNSNKPEILFSEQSDWIKLLMVSFEEGYFNDEKTYRRLLSDYLSVSFRFLSARTDGAVLCREQYDELYRIIQKAISQLFAFPSD